MSIHLEKKREGLRRFVEERAGQKLPGEREMAAQFQVSRAALRKLLDGLEQDGWLERRQGSGTYATPQTTAPQIPAVLLLMDANLRMNDDPFFSLLTEEIQTALQAAGAQCLIRRLSEDEELPRRRDEGVITIGLNAGKRLLESSRPGDRPALVLLTPDAPLPPGAPVSVVQWDNIGAGEAAAWRLAGAGFESLWFVGYASLPASHERLLGAKRVGVPIRLLEAPGMNFTGGQQAAQELPLPVHGDRLGIVAANDWLAVGLHTGLTARGLSPNQFRIVSFDGLDIAASPAFGIESLAVPLAAIAEDAISELRRLSRIPAPPGRVLRYGFNWRT